MIGVDGSAKPPSFACHMMECGFHLAGGPGRMDILERSFCLWGGGLMNAGPVKAMIKATLEHFHAHTFFPSLSHSRMREGLDLPPFCRWEKEDPDRGRMAFPRSSCTSDQWLQVLDLEGLSLQ